MINWSFFSEAIKDYRNYGYSLIDVPWIVNQSHIYATIPDDKIPFYVSENSCLVGSAEQSFVKLMMDHKIPDHKLNFNNKFMALTPCFRDDEEDELHHKYFMKLELIHILNDRQDKIQTYLLNKLIDDARHVMSGFATNQIVSQPTDEGYDLILNNIEIGSYGIREYSGHKWIYGTGLAEPRFSYANGR